MKKLLAILCLALAGTAGAQPLIPSTGWSLGWMTNSSSTSGREYLGITGSTNILVHLTNTDGSVTISQPSAGIWSLSAPAGGASAITNASTLYVGTNGSDTTGTRLRLDKPFLTPKAASSNAVNGDLIYVGPGYYTNTNAVTLASNGVNWYFAPGSFIDHQASAHSVALPPFSDTTNIGGAFYSVSLTNTVRGSASITYSNNLVSAAAGNDAVIYIGNPGTRMDIEAQRIYAHDAGNVSCVVQSNGWLRLKATKLETGSTIPGGTYSPLWWGGGDGYIEVDELNYSTTDDAGAVIVRSDVIETNAYNWYVKAGIIRGSNNASCLYSELSTGGENLRLWVDNNLMTSTGTRAILHYVGYFYVTSQKAASTKTNSSTGGGVIETGVGGQPKLWANIMKISSAGSLGLLLRSGTNEITLQEFEDTANAAGFIGTSAGDHKVRFQTAKLKGNVTNAVGILHTGGTLRVMDGTIDTTSVGAGTNAFGATVSSSGLTLKNVTMNVASGTPVSIYAATPQTITVEGTLKVNKPLHPNITVTGGVVVDTSSGTVFNYGSTGIATNLAGLSVGRLYVSNYQPVLTMQIVSAINTNWGGISNQIFATQTLGSALGTNIASALVTNRVPGSVWRIRGTTTYVSDVQSVFFLAGGSTTNVPSGAAAVMTMANLVRPAQVVLMMHYTNTGIEANTFSLRAGRTNGGSLFINGDSTSLLGGGAQAATLTLEELATP